MKDRILAKIKEHFSDAEIFVEDVSHHHIGHAGHDGKGESHFNLLVTSNAFLGLSKVARHQLVYKILADELKAGIHALSIQSKTFSEL